MAERSVMSREVVGSIPSTPILERKEMTTKEWEQQICATCGHIRLLHLNFKNECDACDDPSIPLEKRCPGFKEK